MYRVRVRGEYEERRVMYRVRGEYTVYGIRVEYEESTRRVMQSTRRIRAECEESNVEYERRVPVRVDHTSRVSNVEYEESTSRVSIEYVM